MVISILKGSKNSKIYQNGFDSLSTYGMYYRKDDNKVIEKTIKEMIKEDILFVTGGLYSVLKITKNFMTKDNETKVEAQKQIEGETKLLEEENDDK